MTITLQPLSTDWFWKEYKPDSDNLKALSASTILSELSDEWSKCAAFPSEIYVELVKKGSIPNPVIGFNEHLVQWVADRDWLYACHFEVDYREQIVSQSRAAQIVFEGLDTICDIYLNGVKVLSTNNMFITYTLDLPTHLLNSKNNTLLIHFLSARRVAKQLEAIHGAVRAGSCNLGDPSRVYLRKAQYHFRWDWGPELITCGPWKQVNLRTYIYRLKAVQTSARVDLEPYQPRLRVEAIIDDYSSHSQGLTVHVSLQDLGGGVIKEESLLVPSTKITSCDWALSSDLIEMWWPTGYGNANLYRMEVTLRDGGGHIHDSLIRTIGFRTIQLIEKPLANSPGTSFYFVVNGTKMFIGGSNWIPADSFLTSVDKTRYKAWLQLLKRGNQNCVRVWGGGIYENDEFYDLCDEMGILVWQDFPFACGVYPAYEEFIQSVTSEARDNITRIRHHPSLAIMCGNNEDYQQILQWDLKHNLPAAIIYEDILPGLVAELVDPVIPYVRGSPYGGEGWDTYDRTKGDVHEWNVWAGRCDPYQDYDIMGGRFVSEFGVPSLPSMKTIEAFFPETEATGKYRHPQSKALQQHNKAGSYERRLAILMNENFRINSDLESYLYLTQLMQSEAVGLAYRVWRRNWKGRDHEETSGVLVWQLNDCWPAISWAIADYYLRPKPAFYAIARELQPITIGVQRTVTKNRPNDRPRVFYEFGAFQSVDATLDIWATNSQLSTKEVHFELYAIDLESDWSSSESRIITLPSNSSTEIASAMHCPHKYLLTDESTPIIPTPSHSVVVAAFLRDNNDMVIAQCVNWPEPLKFVEPRDPQISLLLEGDRLTVKVEYPVKGLVFSVEEGEDDVTWGDNCIDVVPNYPYILKVTGLRGRLIRMAYLGQEKATLAPLICR